MTRTLRPFTSSNLPYEPLRMEGGAVFLYCPRCRARIDIVEHKDVNSFSFAEYEGHYLSEHGADDGLIWQDGAWFLPPEEEPRPLGKAW